ncbi:MULTISPECIES: histidine kinase [unclassified Clostridium]|uniref:histidine kinase n=1 Tax=unclassified Clostridium TaxID=2614128 RepID=UPI00207992A7|nr:MULTISPECIES: histidine kinase [unclassified Clostridium]MBN1051074.1 histidine kinase [Clostridium botulinum]
MIIMLGSVIELFLEALVILNIINSCVKKDCKKSKKELGIAIVLLLILSIIINNLYINDNMDIVCNGILYIIIIGILYKKDFKTAQIICNSIYTLIVILSIIIIGIFYPYIELLNLEKVYLLKTMYFIVFMLNYLCMYILFKYKKYIIRFYRCMVKDKIFISLTIGINLFVYYRIIVQNKIMDFDNPLLKNIMIINLFIFFIITSIYFSSIKKESEQINKLNMELEKKNNDLRKIKHDQGAEISYLYGLYLMSKEEKLGEALENIIDNNNKVKSSIEINGNENGFISKILKPIIEEETCIIIEDNANRTLLEISESELYIVLNNIINCIDGNRGFIRIQTYNILDKLIINIECNVKELYKKRKFRLLNNDIKIDTKKLDLAEELLENHKGTLYVSNMFYSSEFEITLPLV